MARIIEFRPIQQANFSDSNQALALSYDQYDKAIKQANSVADYFNQAVNNRNEAEIQRYINSIPQDEWQARQGEIDAKIAQIAEQSGNQFDSKVINTYRDLRYPTLLERDTKEMKHTTVQQAFGAEQLAWANHALENAKTPEEVEQINAVFDKFKNPIALAQSQPIASALATEIINNQTNKHKAEQDLVKTQLFDTLPAFENAVQNLTRQTAILGITPEDNKHYASVENQVKQFQNQVDSYLNDPKYTPTQKSFFIEILNKQYPEAFNMMEKLSKDRQAQANKDREFALEKFKAENTANYQKGQLEIGKQNADTNTYKILSDDGSSKSGDKGSDKYGYVNKTGNPILDEELAKRGVPELYLPNGGLNIGGLKNHIMNRVRQENINYQKDRTKSFEEWFVSKETQERMTKAPKPSFMGISLLTTKDSRSAVMKAIQELGDYAKQQNMPLKEHEKIHVADGIIGGSVSDKLSDMTNYLNVYRVKDGATRKKTQSDNVMEDVLLISQATGYSDIELLRQLDVVNDPKMKDFVDSLDDRIKRELYPKIQANPIIKQFPTVGDILKNSKQSTIKVPYRLGTQNNSK